jgi:hypothetical protein
MRRARSLALAALLTASTWAQTPAQEDPRSALRACATLEAAAERLACYDRASGRTTPDSGPGAPAAAPPSRASPAPGTSAATVATSPPPKAAPTPAPAASFGLYAAEHPVPPPAAASLTGRVQALGRSGRGRPTVTLDDGGAWELDGTDPLLAVGDVVIIRRAAFNSFLLETPGKRQHRALRLR